MTSKIISLATKKAARSSCCYLVSAVGFDSRGRFVGSAVNSPRFHKDGGGVHAELALLRKFGPKIHKILLCRVGRSGNMLPFDPCPQCQKVLSKKNIKVIKASP